MQGTGIELLKAARTTILLALLVSGCAPDQVAPPRPPEPTRPAVVPDIGDDRPLDEGFCDSMMAAIDSWSSGFAALREVKTGTERWQARPLARNLDRCVIDGSGDLATSYECVSATAGLGDPGSTEAMFERIETLVDHCLARPSWYPRDWIKADPVRLAGGEQQRLWRDQAAWPRPAFQLKLEEDYDRPGHWRIRTLVYTQR